MAQNSGASTPVVIVLFGATGDLSRRMLLPALAQLHARELLPREWRVIGSGRSERSDEDFADLVAEALDEFADGRPRDWDDLSDRFSYVGGEFTADDGGSLPGAVAAVREELGGEVDLVHVLATPPEAFAGITEALDAHGLAEDAAVVYEKPFGTSVSTFEELDRVVSRHLAPEQVFRIDHFLAKESVRGLLAFRFANRLISPIWHRDHVAQVQIDFPETLGVSDRVEFYEETGAALDMLVTHLFQLAAQVAMEPPDHLDDAEALARAREDALAAFRPLDVSEVVLGQFDGYRDLDGVADDSGTDTYVAARLWVDTDRWRGVPFLLRTGKRLADDEGRITLVLREPEEARGRDGRSTGPGTVEIDLADGGSVALRIALKEPGPAAEVRATRLRADLEAGGSTGGPLLPYAAIVHDVLRRDHALFTSAAGLRAAFEAFAPLQSGQRPSPLPYRPGGWGPVEAEALAEPWGWRAGQ